MEVVPTIGIEWAAKIGRETFAGRSEAAVVAVVDGPNEMIARSTIGMRPVAAVAIEQWNTVIGPVNGRAIARVAENVEQTYDCVC